MSFKKISLNIFEYSKVEILSFEYFFIVSWYIETVSQDSSDFCLIIFLRFFNDSHWTLRSLLHSYFTSEEMFQIIIQISQWNIFAIKQYVVFSKLEHCEPFLQMHKDFIHINFFPAERAARFKQNNFVLLYRFWNY